MPTAHGIRDAGVMTAVPAHTSRRRGYGDFWKGLLPELGFLLPQLPVVIIGFAVLLTVFAAGVGMIPILVGVPIVVLALFIARGFGILEIWRLRGAMFPRITPPRWDHRAPGVATSPWLKLIAPAIDGHYWLYLLHGLIVNPIVGVITWTLTIVWLAIGLAGTFSVLTLTPLNQDGIRLVDMGGWLPDVVALVGPGAAIPVVTAIGVLFLATLPFVTHGLVWVHHAIARGMLSAFRSEELREKVADLSASRTAAVAAEGAALRRLERDIHDGPQQRLVRLQMDLAAAERQLDKNPDAARTLIAEARTQSKEALEELRALSRGFAPPILLDRGLVAALESLAVRSPLPVHIENTLPEGYVIPAESARNAYFIAAEALTNVAKHAHAQNAWVRLELHRTADSEWVEIIVTDDGRGGAAPLDGHGLAGIDERVRGLGGAVEVRSPAGGPTHVISRVPILGALPVMIAG